MGAMTLSVTQISNYIKGIFDAEELLIGVKVYGEITNLKPSSRAIYFDLKDENSALQCVCFDGYLMSGFNFGDKVVITGKLNYYAKTGKLSFIASKVEKYGIGDLYKQFLELKDKLEKEGLFDVSHKKKLPESPKRVGVVSSETGAVINDIIRVAREKNHLSDIVLYPVKVQGVGADADIVRGIKFLDNYNVDVIIVARGGGSFEDYQPFNTELVSRAVYEANTPIVSAVGHENDWSLIDYVADQRAGTPSIASEMVFFDEREVVSGAYARLYAVADNYQRSLNLVKKDCTAIFEKINYSLTSSLSEIRYSLQIQKNKLSGLMDSSIESKKHQLEKLALLISANNPIEILSRGYSFTTAEDKAVKSVKGLKAGQPLKTRLSDGIVNSVITNVEDK